MPWLITLHITALLCWCGALLYLPALVIAHPHGQLAPVSDMNPYRPSLPRLAYCQIASPAALVAIIAGTLVFWRHQIFDLWLMIKLVFVTLLVILHLLAGLLISRAEQGPMRLLAPCCHTLTLTALLTIAAILWLVLAKPLRGG